MGERNEHMARSDRYFRGCSRRNRQAVVVDHFGSPWAGRFIRHPNTTFQNRQPLQAHPQSLPTEPRTCPLSRNLPPATRSVLPDPSIAACNDRAIQIQSFRILGWHYPYVAAHHRHVGTIAVGDLRYPLLTERFYLPL